MSADEVWLLRVPVVKGNRVVATEFYESQLY
jgi:hypothetical protein